LTIFKRTLRVTMRSKLQTVELKCRQFADRMAVEFYGLLVILDNRYG